MPKGPKGAAAAGSFCKTDGETVCPWCVCIKYPENEKWWREYEAAAVAFIYAKEENGVATDACCVLLTARDALSVLEGTFAYSQVEGIENEGLADDPDGQREVLNRLYGKTGLTDNRLVKIFAPVLKPMEEKFKAAAAEEALIAASKDGDAMRVRECLNAGDDVDVADKIGWTALHHASHGGYLDVCKLLIDAGADVNAQNLNGETPLSIARIHGHSEVEELLLNAGAKG